MACFVLHMDSLCCFKWIYCLYKLKCHLWREFGTLYLAWSRQKWNTALFSEKSKYKKRNVLCIVAKRKKGKRFEPKYMHMYCREPSLKLAKFGCGRVFLSSTSFLFLWYVFESINMYTKSGAVLSIQVFV